MHISQKTIDEIEKFVNHYPYSPFGPAHLVLGDLNVQDHNIKYCLFALNKKMKEYEATKEFLLSLLQVPEEER